MNKIYKVVWSKAKHCYVVTSELAKRQTKGCGARSLRMATVSLGVAASLLCSGAVLPVFGESVAEAGSVGVVNKLIMGDGLEWNGSTTAVTITADTIDTINNNINADPRKHAYGNITYTYGSEKFNAIAERDVVSFKDVDGQLIECHDAPITVIQQYPSAMDGYDTNKDVSGYSITINNTSDKLLYAVYGGYSKEGNVDENTVTINDGTITDSVSGGYSDGGKVSNNTVNLYGGTVGNGYETAYGGRSEGKAGNAGNAEYNHVNINGGTAKGNVYGGHSHSSNSPSGDVIGNTVTIAKGKVTGYGSQWIYGGYTWGKDGEGENASGKAEDNTVIIKGGTLSHDTSAAEVSGGVSNGGDAIHNIVNVENTFTDTLESVTGGEAGENGTATKNEVTVSGGTVNSDVIGGQAAGAVKENKVTVNKITVKGDVVGGFTETGAMENNEVTINGGTVEGTVYGGRTTNGIAGGDSAEKGNKVTVDGKANLYGVYGGYSQSGAASYNTVDVKDCERTSAYGGYSYSGGEVSHNTVTMSGGDSIGLYGGENYSGAGDVTHNTAILKGGAVGLYLFGGYTNGTGKATSNKVEISGGAMTQHGYGYVLAGGRTKDGDALDNTVTISAGEIGKWSGARNDKTTLQIAGGYVYGYGGKATGNAIDISGGTFGGAYEIDTDTGVETGELGIVVYGGYTRGTDSGIVASNNTVTISKDAVLTGAATVAGGTVNRDKELDPKGSADYNTITISGGTIGTGDKESAIYGGLGAASASNNTVTIKENAKLNENTNIYGGKAALYYTNYSTGATEEELTGTASNNTVNISNAVTVKNLYGGAGGTAEKNDVTISEGTVSRTLYGGYSETGAATQNSVSISGGTVNGNVWGGFSKSGNPTKNSVTISGGTFNGQGIVGGYLQNKTGYNGSANENTVTISGGTFGGNVLFVQGGYTLNADNTTNNNTINLTGTVTGLENVSFYGGGSNTSNTGNELHVGGIKGGDNGVWQGKTGDTVNNKVKYVGRFDKVVLHSVKWDETVPALEVNTLDNVKTLDITNIQFDQTPTSGYMALLKSGSDLGAGGVGIGLAYKDGGTAKTATSADLVTGVTFDSGELIDKAVNGITLTGTQSKKVSLEESNKEIRYSFSSAVTGITIATDTFTAGGTARSFGSGDNLTGATITNNLAFSADSKKSMQSGQKMVILDATKAVAVSGATLPAFTAQTYHVDFSDAISGKVVTLSGKHTDTLAMNDSTARTQLVYTVGDKNVNKAAFNGEVAWDNSQAYYTADAQYKFGTTDIDVENLKVTGTTTNALRKGDAMTLLSASGLTAGTVTPQSDANKTASKISVNYSDATSGIGFGAEATGEVKTAANAVSYEVTGVTLDSVDLGSWNGTTSSVPEGWTAVDKSVAVNNADAITAVPAATQAILTAGSGMFADVNIVKEVAFDPVTQNGVTISGTRTNGIRTTQTNVANDTITYEIGKQKDVKNVAIGTVEWGGASLDGSNSDYNYANVASIGTDKFAMTYATPESVAAKDSMTLLKANATLKDMAEQTKATNYSYEPVSGVTVDAAVTGALTVKDGAVTFTAAENRASKLTFGDVEWKTGGALVTRPANITFAGTAVDTTKINFTNMIYLDANQKMTLVSDFGDSVGTITGSKYMVGTAFEGEGEASLSGGDLIFTTKTEAGLSEQTHKTVMAMDANMAMLKTGGEFVDKTMDGLADKKNAGDDGISTYATVGGEGSRYSTGSHVNTHTWNAIVAVGKTNETKKGTLEYGVFGEYGKGSYKLYSDAGNGDGDAHYAGGGLLAKWTNSHDVYAEASIRLGRLSDSSSNIMQDGLGNRYGYNVHANYYGTHVGVGRVFNYEGGKSLDVYGKFFYTKRDGVEYDAPQHYDLDSVASSVLRIGARYGTTDKKWNWYGGLAYEYEFDGEAKGTVNGKEIRAASIRGSSVRGEFGMKMSASKDNPWQADISIYGYGGKHRGFGGNVSVAYTF